MPVTANPLLDLVPGVGTIQSDVRWVVLTRALEDTGIRLHPFSADRIDANTGSQIKRNLFNVVFGEEDIRSVDLFKALLQPQWVLEDGTSWPMGAFMFTDESLHLGTYASTSQVTLMDQGYVLSLKMKEPFAITPGGSILAAVGTLLDQVGIAHRVLPVTDQAIADPNSWPAGTQRQTIIDYLCKAAGWLPGYFNNAGVYIIRVPPNLDIEQPDHIYHGNRVSRPSPVSQANTLKAFNTFVVIGTGPSKGDISAVAYVDPSLPYSVPNRGGLEVVETIPMQGLVSSSQAQQIADSRASSAVGYQGQTFAGPPDPRHDLFDTVEYMDGIVYRELSWSLPLVSTGGFMNHVLTLGGFPNGS